MLQQLLELVPGEGFSTLRDPTLYVLKERNRNRARTRALTSVHRQNTSKKSYRPGSRHLRNSRGRGHGISVLRYVALRSTTADQNVAMTIYPSRLIIQQ